MACLWGIGFKNSTPKSLLQKRRGFYDTFVGRVPTLVGKAPTLVGKAPTLEGRAPTLEGRAPTLEGKAPTLVGRVPTHKNLLKYTKISAKRRFSSH